MTNKRSTKRALLMSLLAMLLCVTMLVGTTFAWFTDSVTSSGNIIKSGTLDVEMYWANGEDEVPADEKGWTNANTGAIFNYDKWEPGYVAARHIKIANNGTLALKYQVNIIANGEVGILADVIDVYYVDPATTAITRDDLTEDKKLGTLTEVLANMGKTANGYLLEGDSETITIALMMQESAGNEYQGKSIGTDFSIQLLATQFTYEEDSFDENYDKDALLGDLVVADENSDLLAILASAKKDQPLTIILEGDVTYTTAGHNGAADVTPASSVVIDGKGKYTLTATGSGVTPIGDSEAVFTFRDLTVADESVSYDEAAWELSYLELGNVVCENVVFADPIIVEGQNASFNNCTFNGVNDTANGITMYGVWVANGDSTFTHCTFQNNRGMKICDRYAPEVGTVVIDGCTFQNLEQKPGVAIDDWETRDMKITIKNSTFINCQPGDQGLYVYETDNTVPTVENNTHMSAVNVTVTNATELKDALSAAGAAGAGNTLIKLSGDPIDLTGETWTPIKVDGYHGADIITIDGNGTVITGLTAPLFAGGFAGGSGIVIKNLTIADSNIVSTNTLGSGAFIESCDSMNIIELYNCHLKNSTVTGGAGSRTGGLIGWTAGYNNVNDGPVKTYVKIKDCSVIGNTITCDGSVGGIYGHAGNNAWTYSTVENCIVKNNVLSSTDDGEWRVGVVVGTANVGEMTISGIIESGNTLTQTGKTAPDGQSNLYGRFVPGTTGKLVIDKVEIN